MFTKSLSQARHQNCAKESSTIIGRCASPNSSIDPDTDRVLKSRKKENSNCEINSNLQMNSASEKSSQLEKFQAVCRTMKMSKNRRALLMQSGMGK